MNTIGKALARFHALSLRERLMAVFAAVVVLYFLFDLALLGPQRSQTRLLQQKVAQQKVELASLDKAMAALSSGARAGSASAQTAERDALRRQVESARTLFGDAAAQARMGEVIRSMISATPGLTLVSIKTLPVQPFFKLPAGTAAPIPAAAASASAPSSLPELTLYRHGLEVAVKGQYLALIPYLQSLERSPHPMFWGEASVETTAWPDATLRMVVHTLSVHADAPLN